MTLLTIIHCPACHFGRQETMPTDTCLVVYECAQCGAVLRPKTGDCCVFCSYADDPCPSMQTPDVPSE